MKKIFKNTKRFMIAAAAVLLTGLCTAGIINAAGNYNYGSASIAGKIYENYSDTSKPGQPWGLTMNNIVIEDASSSDKPAWYENPLQDIGTHSTYAAWNQSVATNVHNVPLANSFSWLPYDVHNYSRMIYMKLYKIPLNSAGNLHITFGNNKNNICATVYELNASGNVIYDGGWIYTSDSYTITNNATQYVLLYLKYDDGNLNDTGQTGSLTTQSMAPSDVWDTNSQIKTYVVFHPYTIDLVQTEATTKGSTAVYERFGAGVYTDYNGKNPMTTSKNFITAPKRTGYTFLGYYEKPNGEGKQMITAGGVIVPANFTNETFNRSNEKKLYAHWKKNQYPITLNAPDATNTNFTKNLTATYDTAYPSISVLPQRKYTVSFNSNGGSSVSAQTSTYTFKGYYSATSGGTQYYNGSGTAQKSTYTIANSLPLYAQWTAKAVSLATPTRIGHTFGGWSYNGNTYTGSFTPTANTTMVAQWTANKYGINYYANGGTGTMAADSITYGTAFKTKQNAFTRPGYTFTGWNEKADGTGTAWTLTTAGVYESGKTATWSRTAALNLYAQWTPNNYTLSYDKNTGTGTMSADTVRFDSSFKTKQNAFTKAGHTFTGWNEKADGTGTAWTLTTDGVYESGKSAVWKRVGNVTLYAQWTPNNYTITYNGNGGTGSMESDSITYGTTFKTKQNAYAKIGYTFTGWNEKADGTGTAWTLSTNGVYESGNSAIWLRAENITLYAQWTPNEYNVSYNANTGTGTMASDTIKYDSDYKTKENIFTKTGYTFAGWNEKADGTGTAWTLTTDGVFESGNSVKWNRTENVTLYAQWTPNSYIVNYDKNTGTGSMESDSVKYDSDYITKENTFTKTGYTFAGWNENANGIGISWTPSTNGTYESGNSITWKYTRNITLYAQWKPNTYTVSYDANTGTGLMNPDTVTYDTQYMTQKCSFSKVGYTFVGWNESPNGSGAAWKLTAAGVFESGNSIKWNRTENITLYAQWVPNEYNVSYDANTGTGSMEDDTILYDSEYTTKENIFSKVGHTFIGWNEKPDGTGLSWTPSTNGTYESGNSIIWKFLSNKTLYAQWAANKYTVSYNANMGTGSMNDDTVYYGDLYKTQKCGFTRKGYTFSGWNEKADGTGKAWTLNSAGVFESGNDVKWLRTENITLYAQWVPNKYTVTYDGNTGTGSMGSDEVFFDNEYMTKKNIFTKTGYTFVGWNEKADGTGKAWNLNSDGVYESGNSMIWNYTNNVKLYAQWVPNKYTITIIAKTEDRDHPGKFIDGKVNGKSEEKVQVTYDSSENNNFKDYLATYAGREFVGYYTEDGYKVFDFMGNLIEQTGYWKDGKWAYAGDLTVYAEWKSRKPIFEIEGDDDFILQDELDCEINQGAFADNNFLLKYLINDIGLSCKDCEGNSMEDLIILLDNGKFDVNEPGLYKVILAATDGFDNYTEKTINVTVNRVYPALNIKEFGIDEIIKIYDKELPTFKVMEGAWYKDYVNSQNPDKLPNIPLYSKNSVDTIKYLLGKGDEDANGLRAMASQIGYIIKNNEYIPIEEDYYWGGDLTNKILVTKIEYFVDGKMIDSVENPDSFNTSIVGIHKLYIEVSNKYNNKTSGVIEVEVMKNDKPSVITSDISIVKDDVFPNIIERINILDDQEVIVEDMLVFIDNMNYSENMNISTSFETTYKISVSYRDKYGKKGVSTFNVNVVVPVRNKITRFISYKYEYTLNPNSIWNTDKTLKERLHNTLIKTHDDINANNYENCYSVLKFDAYDLDFIKKKVLLKDQLLRIRNLEFLSKYGASNFVK